MRYGGQFLTADTTKTKINVTYISHIQLQNNKKYSYEAKKLRSSFTLSF